jgi:hypothetical protein
MDSRFSNPIINEEKDYTLEADQLGGWDIKYDDFPSPFKLFSYEDYNLHVD